MNTISKSNKTKGGIWACLPLCTLLVLFLFAVTLLQAIESQDPVLDRDTAKKIQYLLNATRTRSGLKSLADDRSLQEQAERGAAAFLKAFRQQPEKATLPGELSERELRKVFPRGEEILLRAGAAADMEQIIQKAMSLDLVKNQAMTHLAIGVSRGTLREGQPVWFLVVLASSALPEIHEELINQGQRSFFMTCHQCRYAFAGRIQLASGSQIGTLEMKCPACGLTFDVFGMDARGEYHRPPWFLRGFKPADLDDPLQGWLFVLQLFRYLEDSKEYGRSDVWQTAEQTYRKRGGDCEDTAILLGDWLRSSGFEARVVLGRLGRTGHAWVVLSEDGKHYILETTGGAKRYRRIPPRAEMLTLYFPLVQFDRSGVWFRRSNGWTADYAKESDWAKNPAAKN